MPKIRIDEIRIDSNIMAFADESAEYYHQKYVNSIPIRMVTKEDTGVLDQNDRRDVEIKFKQKDLKQRKIDVIVATPTLELGVDIGDLHCTGLLKVPPSPANYLQRVGRAGRSSGISFNNTFVFQNSIDNYYYRRPEELIKGEVNPPYINLNNPHMLQRHTNAIIIEDLFVHSNNYHLYPLHSLSKFVERNALHTLRQDISSRRRLIFSKIKEAFRDSHIHSLDDTQVEEMINNFESSVVHSLEKYNEELQRYEAVKESLIQRKKEGNLQRSEYQSISRKLDDINVQIWNLSNRKSILNHFMDTGVLPRYAFPGMYVDLQDELGGKEFSGRSRNIAITEYAPGMEFYAMKKIYRSSGIDIKFARPYKHTLFICQACKKYISKEHFNICSICKQNTQTYRKNSIVPDLIYLRDTGKRISEPRDFQEPDLEVYLSAETDRGSRSFDNLILTKYGNIKIFQVVDKIITNEGDQLIELCNTCGRARDDTNKLRHRELGRLKSICKGNFEPVSIYHEMPTNVISIRINGESLFQVPLTHGQRNTVFLTTLKSAIVNAGQLLFRPKMEK